MATYTVKPGDSWFRIAGILYGDQRMAGELQAMNAGIDVLQPGMKIKIPDKPAEGYVPYIAPGQMEAWFGQAVQYEWMTPEEQAGWVERYLELAGPEGQGFGISEGFAEYLGTTGLLPGTEPVADEQFGLGTTGGPADRPARGRGPGGGYGAPGGGIRGGVPSGDVFAPATGRGPGGGVFGPRGRASPGQAVRQQPGLDRGARGPQPGYTPPGPEEETAPVRLPRPIMSAPGRWRGPQPAAGGFYGGAAAGRPPTREEMIAAGWGEQEEPWEPRTVIHYPGGEDLIEDLLSGKIGGDEDVEEETIAYRPGMRATGDGPATGRGPGGRRRPPGEEFFADEGERDAEAILAFVNQVPGAKLPAKVRNSTLHLYPALVPYMEALGYRWDAERGFWVLETTAPVTIGGGGGGYYRGYKGRTGGGGGGRGRGGGYYSPRLMGLVNWRIGS